MNNRYQEYNPEDFEYDYPITWFKRNKKYLEKTDDRGVLIRDLTDIIQEVTEEDE